MVLPKRVRTVKWENGILTLDNDKKFEGTEENYYQDKEIESIIQNHFVLSEKQRALFYGAFDHDVNTIADMLAGYRIGSIASVQNVERK